MNGLDRKLRKFGNSLAITIPSEIIKVLELKEGDMLNIDIKNNHIIIDRT